MVFTKVQTTGSYVHETGSIDWAADGTDAKKIERLNRPEGLEDSHVSAPSMFFCTCQVSKLRNEKVSGDGFAPGAHVRGGGEKVQPRTHTVAQHRLEKGQLAGRACLLLNERPACASNATKFIYHPAALLALRVVKRTFASDPTSIT
jgi:hypothetical protein